MKKLILALLFLLLSCSISFAENQQLAWMGPVIAGSGGSAAVTEGKIGTKSAYNSDSFASDMHFTQFTTTTAGTIGWGHIRLSDGKGGNHCINLYNTSGELLLNCSGTASNGVDGWDNVQCSGTYDIQAGVSYWLGYYNSKAGVGIYRDNTASWGIDVDSSLTTPCSDNISKDSDKTSYDLVIYFNNTSGNP